MLTNFEQMADNARIWIYQADRPLDKEERQEAMLQTQQFLAQWAAHGSDLRASATIKYDHFLIICIDESFQMASGCSIDSSVHFVQSLGQQLGINFFERTNLAFLAEENIEIVKLKDLKGQVASGAIGPDSLFFENTIQSKGQLQTQWLVKAGETWLKRYFKAALNV